MWVEVGTASVKLERWNFKCSLMLKIHTLQQVKETIFFLNIVTITYASCIGT